MSKTATRYTIFSLVIATCAPLPANARWVSPAPAPTDRLVDTTGALSPVAAEIDGTGAVSDSYTYEAPGTTLSHSGLSENPHQFAGGRFVGEVGMYQNRARWMDTRTGRFVSVDPENGQARLPMSFQPYLYCSVDPVNHVDPTGQVDMNLVSVMATMSIRGALSGMAIGGVSGAVNGAILYGPGGALEGLQSGMISGALFGAFGGGLTGFAMVTRNTLPLLAYTAGMTGWGVSEGLKNINSDDPNRQTVGGIQLALSVVGGAMGAKTVSYLNTGKAYLPQYQKYQADYESAPGVPIAGEAGLPDGKFIFVVRMDRTVAYYARGETRFPHPRLSGGENVLSAGEMEVVGGKVASITNQSGHFQPSSLSLYIAEVILRSKGLWAAGGEIIPFK